MHSLALLLLGLVPAAERDFAVALENEAARVQRESREIRELDPSLKESKDLIDSFIGRTSEALKAHRYYVGLEELGRARVILDAIQTVRDNEPAIQNGMPGFEGEWAKAAVAMKNGNGKLVTSAELPAAVLAIAESAHGKAIPVLDAARAWAAENDARFGFYYLGSAKGAANFAGFCSSLKIARQRPALPMRSVSLELNELQKKVLSAYNPPASIERHSEFIRLNGALKSAGELDAAELYSGALYTYLDAVLQYAAFGAEIPNAHKKAKLRKDLEALQQRLHGSERDESIAELFLERAAAQLAAKSPNDSVWKNVEAIVDRVLPAYFAVLEPQEKPQEKTSADTTVTLIRWPYT